MARQTGRPAESSLSICSSVCLSVADVVHESCDEVCEALPKKTKDSIKRRLKMQPAKAKAKEVST